jgi:hypothetical protein
MRALNAPSLLRDSVPLAPSVFSGAEFTRRREVRDIVTLELRLRTGFQMPQSPTHDIHSPEWHGLRVRAVIFFPLCFTHFTSPTLDAARWARRVALRTWHWAQPHSYLLRAGQYR